MAQNVLVEKRGVIAVVTVDRPEVLNALNAATIQELKATFDALDRDDELRAIILTGSGTRAFIAGADITEMQGLSAPEAVELAQRGQSLSLAMEAMTKPIIAAVNGFALGGGCELMMACDFAIASERAKFGQPEVNLGLIPGFGGTQRLARLVGRGLARQLVYTGEMLSAERALSVGLITEVTSPEELMPRAVAIAELIAEKAPLAVAACKKALNRGVELPLEAALDFEAVLFGAMFNTADMREGTQAFTEKRPAQFRGR